MNLNVFLIKNDKLVEKYNDIWDKVNNTIKKRFDSEPVYNKKYLRTKIRSYESKISTNFHDNKIKYQKKVLNAFASAILLDSIFS